jgi:hypothetical protein
LHMHDLAMATVFQSATESVRSRCMEGTRASHFLANPGSGLS